ncbi:MAG: TolC family protein, partial [Candidatus Zixiibacteriota bacterium]
GMELEQMRQFINETMLAGVPTFSSEGFLILEKGATAANCIRPDLPLGRFTAYKIIQIANGALPASLPTIFNEAPALCLNLDAARKLKINFDRSSINNAKTIAAVPAEGTPGYTLNEATDQALRENVSFLGNNSLYQKAIAEAAKTYSTFYPDIKLDLEAATTDNENSAALYNNILNRRFSSDIILDQKLFSYPAIKAVQIAQKNLQIKEAGLRQAELDLRHAVTVAYLAVLENEENVRAIEDKIDRLRQYWEIALANAAIGNTDTLDILILQERLVSAKMLLHDANSRLRVSRVVLNVLLNRPGDETVVLDKADFSPEIMVAMARKFENYASNSEKQQKFEDYLIHYGIVHSTDMQIAGLSIDIQRDLLAKNGKRYLPEITLRGKYSYSDEFEPEYGGNDDSWTIGGYLTLPILSGWQWKHNRASLKAEMDGLQYKKDMIRFERMETIVAAVEKLLTHVTTLPMNYFTKNLASDNLNAAYRKFKSGKMTVSDLVSLEHYASSLEFNLVERKYNFFVAYAEMLQAAGAGYLVRNSAEELEFYKNLENYLE